ncbi:MAG TPA: ribbon-helix-helix domain-containing protein [archaeon]|nr:ribbon-helix-helix domain-containing protein [archaeon]
MMEIMSIKIESAFVRQIERDMKDFNYSTKTEFVRESIREKLQRLDDERKKKVAWDALFAARGIFKGKGKAKTDDEFYKLREEAGKEFMGILEKRFSQK